MNLKNLLIYTRLYSFPLFPFIFFIDIFIDIFQFYFNLNILVTLIFLFQLPRVLHLCNIFFFLNIENDENSYETKNCHIYHWILDVLSNDSRYRRERSANKINYTVSLSSHKDWEKILVNMVTKVLNRANLQP